MRIAQQNLHTLLATQLLLVATFYTQLSDIVARLVIVVLLDIGWRHLCHITQHMGSKGEFVLADRATLDIKAWETEHLLLKYGEVLVAELAHEHLLRKARIARILVAILDGSHTTVEFFTRNIHHIAEIGSIQVVLGLVHHHHNVVGRLIIDQQLTVAVVDTTTGWIFYLFQESVRVGTLLIVIARNLQLEQTKDIYDHD